MDYDKEEREGEEGTISTVQKDPTYQSQSRMKLDSNLDDVDHTPHEDEKAPYQESSQKHWMLLEACPNMKHYTYNVHVLIIG